jgi:hypothetical protein
MYLDFNGRRVDFNLTSTHGVAAVITALVITVGVLAYLLWMPREKAVAAPTKMEDVPIGAQRSSGPKVADRNRGFQVCEGGLLDDDNVCWPCERIWPNTVWVAELHGCRVKLGLPQAERAAQCERQAGHKWSDKLGCVDMESTAKYPWCPYQMVPENGKCVPL